jgi:hypothetical protein
MATLLAGGGKAAEEGATVPQEGLEILDPLNLRAKIEEEAGFQFDPSLEIERNIEEEIKEATGITALEEERTRLEQESAAQRREFASILEEAQAAPTEASRAAALARRRRRAGATRASTRVARGRQTPGVTGRTTLGG